MTQDGAVEPVIWSRRLPGSDDEDRREQLEASLLEGRLPFFTDAELLREYMDRAGLSQSACARKLGRSQAGVANRLRLLKLSSSVRAQIQTYALSERHARALLRLETEDKQLRALEAIHRFGMNVAQTESYIDELKSAGASPADDMVFGPLLRELEHLRAHMPDIEYRLSESPDTIRFLILIPQKYAQNERK